MPARRRLRGSRFAPAARATIDESGDHPGYRRWIGSGVATISMAFIDSASQPCYRKKLERSGGQTCRSLLNPAVGGLECDHPATIARDERRVNPPSAASHRRMKTMAVYLVTYDLRSETRRPPIVKELKDKYDWCYLSESSYAISTTQGVTQVHDFFKKFIDENDYLLVIPLRQPYRGWTTEAVHDWLDRNLPA